MKAIFLFLFISITIVCSAQSSSETLTNQTIIQLYKVGLGTDVIKSKIQSSPCTFDLSTDGLIALKKAGIPDGIITAMLAKQTGTQTTETTPEPKTTTVTLNPGIYFYDSTKNTYTELDPSIITNQKAGGLGETLKRSFSGLFNAKQRASLSSAEASMTLHSTRPLFFFVFDTTVNGFSNNNTFWSSAQSPNEFFLVKLTVVKNSREVVVGKENNISSNMGIADELKVPFTIKKTRKGLYEVAPTNSLQSGQYCFMFAASSSSGGQSHKVFDFGVK